MPPQPPQPARTPTIPSGRRVLGSATALSPAVKARTMDASVSPSASTTSLNSQFSSTDIGEGGQANDRSSLVCPICSEEMVTLLQLNRHLDDVHREVEEEEINDVKTWFKKRVLKAKQFQPVAVINQKLKGLDIFESNHVLAASPPANGTNGGVTVTPKLPDKDPDEMVTRAHWQKSTGNDFCLDPMCQKPLGVVNGSVNCRKCGKLFCEEHTMYQIKLSRSAQHEPVRGVWCRVCETCFKSREGYNDHNGLTRDHTSEFKSVRTKTLDRTYLEITRLEKRLTKLTQLLTQPPEPSPITGVNNFLASLTTQRSQRKQLEQKVVAWEEDDKVSSCPYCKQTFSKLGIRKHHCRLCGRVVCGDLRTGCSLEVSLNVTPSILHTNHLSSSPSPATAMLSEKSLNSDSNNNRNINPDQITLDIRSCRQCRSTIWSKHDFFLDLASQPPLVRAYSTLIQFQSGITSLLPRFQKLFFQIQDESTATTTATKLQLVSEANSTRKKLLNTFTQYESSAKRILNLPTESPTQLNLQKAIYLAATQFLQQHMLPLKNIPHHPLATKQSKRRATPLVNNSSSPSILPSSFQAGTSEEHEQQESPQIEKEAEREEKYQEFQQQLIVLEEQKYMLNAMLSEAKKGKKWDECKTLKRSIEELDGEISRIKGEAETLGIEAGL